MPINRPLVPSDVSDPGTALRRAAYAAFAASLGSGHTSAAAMCERAFPRDAAALAVITRGAISGATTSNPAWAGALYQRATTAFFMSLTPESAVAALIPRGTRFQMIGVGALAVPVLTSAIGAAPWVLEGGAVPVGTFTFGTVNLDPRKMALLIALTGELSRFSDASAVFDRLLRQVGAYSLDAAYFSTDTGATAGHHAGLLAGLTPLAGSAVKMTDLGALASAVSGPGSSGQVAFVMAPGRAATAALDATLNATILSSPAVPADRVIAVDPLALIHGFGTEIDLSVSTDAVIQLDTAPSDNLGTAGTPPVVAAPAVSMFQADQTVTRLLVDVSFAKGRAGCVAFANGCTW